MKNMDNYLYKYGLHDCVVDKICIQNNSLVFYFETGVYNLDENGHEITKTAPCLMCFEIDHLNIDKMWEYIEIYRFTKNTVCEIEYEDYIEEINKFKFDIQENYFSYFGRSILLEGYTSNYRYQIKISAITKIEFKFE